MYAALLIGSVLCGPVVTAVVLSIFAVIAVDELESSVLSGPKVTNWRFTETINVITVGCFIFSGILNDVASIYLLVIFCALVMTRFLTQLFIRQDSPLKSISLFVFEVFYIGIPLFLFTCCVSIISNPWIIICALAMIWISDTGAFLVGSLVGKHKLFPRLSPKKSWEGFLGGLMFNIGAAFIYFYCFHLTSADHIHFSLGLWIIVGIITTIFATLGDLFESMIKRSLGIKDFGKLIPGHGGILDRIDSLLFVVPSIIFIVILLAYGQIF